MTRISGVRPWRIVPACLLIVGSGVYLASLWRGPGEVAPLGPNTTTIVPGVHMLGGLGPSASYVVETSEGLVLVDTGLDRDAGLLKQEMSKLGLDWGMVRKILLTHAHGDHCGGAEHLRAKTGAKVHAGRDDTPPLKAGGPREAFFSTFHMPNHAPHPTTVDVELTGDEQIASGKATFRALAMPGHTPGSICYLMERGGLRGLFGGDVISMLVGEGSAHPTAKKPLGTYSAYLSPRFRGDAETYLASIRKLRELPVPDLVLPGHPASDPTPQSPRLTQARWEEMMDEGIKEMETLLARYRADGADFLDGQPKKLLDDLYYLGDFRGSAVYVFFAGTKLFLVDAPGGDGLHDFISAGLKTLGLPATDPTAILLTSCNAKDMAGLKDMLAHGTPSVIAPPSGLEIVKQACPPDSVVLPADDLHKQNWFPVTPIPLRGRGRTPMAYLLPWAGKQVLFSGRIPILFDHNSTEALGADLSGSRNDAVEYLLSINTLAALNPDLWLPAAPSNDQNANLYDTEWKYIIANNYRVGRSILERSR